MTAREIFEACTGRNENGESNSTIRISTSIMFKGDMTEETRDELISDKPVVDIFQTDRLTVVSMHFDDPFDTDFLSGTSIINDFQTFNNTANGESSPIITLAIMPRDLNGYYVMGVGGIAVVQPSEPGGTVDTLSFIFANDTIGAYLLDTDAIDKNTEE